MSMYNLVNGVNPLTLFLIPMLGDIHPEGYPRFRDCFMDTGEDEPKFDQDIIVVYTRVGGGNRGNCGEEWLYRHENFLKTYDDDFDNTYGSYVFSVPEKWRADYALLKEGNINGISQALKDQVDKVFPKMQGKLPWHTPTQTEV